MGQQLYIGEGIVFTEGIQSSLEGIKILDAVIHIDHSQIGHRIRTFRKSRHMTLEELAESFPREIVEAVDLLTHREGVEYFDYVRSIRANPVAVKVKLADLRHNGDPKRISNQGNAEKRREKYAKAWKILTEA